MLWARLVLNPALLARMLLAGVLLALSACATRPSMRPATDAQNAADGVTFVVVRHAEKLDDGSENPPLSPQGQARAHVLEHMLRDAPLQAVYATEFQRTLQTAAPTAAAHGLPVTAYFSRGPVHGEAAQWLQRHRHGTVLVVGHSNTVADIAATLCRCATVPMDEREYDRYTEVHIGADGRAALQVRRYGAELP